MRFEFSEELKEALARAKGSGHILMGIIDGEVKFYPDCFDIISQQGDRIVLQAKRPTISPESEKLVAEIITQIEPALKSSIVDAVSQSLREKPLAELLQLAQAKEVKIQRRRGCLWIITDKTEHVL